MAKSLKHSFNTPDQVRLAPRARRPRTSTHARARRLSFSLPSPPALFPRAQALKLTRVYGINLDAHGPNLFAAAGNCVVYAVAAICVVHELESGGQRFFHGHRDDISALAVDPEGKIAASGQVTSTTSPAFVCVWEIETCAELFRIGMTQPPAIERMVAALAFTPDSTHLVTVGADDRHSLKVWDLTDEKTPVFEGQAQNGKPPASGACTARPRTPRAPSARTTSS